MKKLFESVKAFISHYFGDESAAINETMRYDAVHNECTTPLPVDYPAVDQSEEPKPCFCYEGYCGGRCAAGAAPVVKPKYEVLQVIISDQFSDQWQTSPYRVSGDRIYIHADYAGCKARIEYTVNGAYTSKTVRLKKRK